MKAILILGLASLSQIALVKPPILIDHREPKQVEIVQFKKLEPLPLLDVPTARVTGSKPKPVSKPSGNKESWLRAAGVPERDWEAAIVLVQKESSWNPLAVNPSSGACSLAQALPCSKIPGDWRDPVNALKWMDNYCKQRYGGWSQALSFHRSHNWY